MRRRPTPDLTNLLGHSFRTPALLAEALTHPSAASAARPDNQRLEFLGDRVLGLVIATALLDAFPGEAEGTLAPRFNALVRRETLADVALDCDLSQHIELGRSESLGGGRRKAALLADAVEAVIAALYLDGGYEAAERFILKHWHHRLTAHATAPQDAKTRLQEWAQGHGLGLPVYALVHRSGPDHAPEFTVAVSVEDHGSATGRAASKKLAEQTAATALLDRIGVPEE